MYVKKFKNAIDKFDFACYTCKVIWFTPFWRYIMFEKNLSISLLVDFYGDILTERQNEMINMYYNEDCSLSEIAESFNISRQGVRSVLKKGEEILLDMENKLHLASRFIQMREKSSEIAIELQKINSDVNNTDISNRINLLIGRIKDLADY